MWLIHQPLFPPITLARPGRLLWLGPLWDDRRRFCLAFLLPSSSCRDWPLIGRTGHVTKFPPLLTRREVRMRRKRYFAENTRENMSSQQTYKFLNFNLFHTRTSWLSAPIYSSALLHLVSVRQILWNADMMTIIWTNPIKRNGVEGQQFWMQTLKVSHLI